MSGDERMAESGERRARAFDQPFADAFPEVRDAVVEYEISGRDLGGATTSYGRTTISVLAGNFQGRIPCPHPQCHAGGFEIERIVDQMVKARRRPGKEYSSAPDGSGIATGSRASIASATPSSSSFDPARPPRSCAAEGEIRLTGSGSHPSSAENLAGNLLPSPVRVWT